MKSRPEFIKHYSEIQDPPGNYKGDPELLSIGSPFAKRMGLTKLGIHHELLPPGRRTSWPHAESHEEEFVYVIEGNPDVWIDGELYRLEPGDGVSFPSGTGVCHTVINNTKSDVRLLVVGEANKKENQVYYACHPEKNEELRAKKLLWEEWPKREMGEHDGKPNIQPEV